MGKPDPENFDHCPYHTMSLSIQRILEPVLGKGVMSDHEIQRWELDSNGWKEMLANNV
jgi:hypothetical protein